MSYIKYVKDNFYVTNEGVVNCYQYYQCSYADTSEIYIIGMFLMDNVGSRGQNYQQWTLDDSSDYCSGNATTLKKEDGFIIVSDTYSERDDGGPYVKVLPREFVNLLDQWQRVFERQPKEIIITEIDGVYAVEGRD